MANPSNKDMKRYGEECKDMDRRMGYKDETPRQMENRINRENQQKSSGQPPNKK